MTKTQEGSKRTNVGNKRLDCMSYGSMRACKSCMVNGSRIIALLDPPCSHWNRLEVKVATKDRLSSLRLRDPTLCTGSSYSLHWLLSGKLMAGVSVNKRMMEARRMATPLQGHPQRLSF